MVAAPARLPIRNLPAGMWLDSTTATPNGFMPALVPGAPYRYAPPASFANSIAPQSAGLTMTVSGALPVAHRAYLALLIDSTRLAPLSGVKAVKLPASGRPDRFRS